MLQDELRNRTSGLNFSPTTLDLGDLEKDPDIARPPSVQGVPKKSTHCLDLLAEGNCEFMDGVQVLPDPTQLLLFSSSVVSDSW